MMFSMTLLLLSTSSVGVSVNTSTITTNQRPPLTVNEWASSIWGSFSSKVEVGWNKVANETSKTFNKVSSDVKDGWDQLANKTVPTFKAISSNAKDSWDVVANGTTTTFKKVATDVQDGWEMVSNKTVTSYKHSTSRISFVFKNLYCPPSNKTLKAINSTLDDSFDDGPVIQEFSCMAIKVLKVIGISILGGLGVVIALPIAFFLIIEAIGFTGSGVLLGSCAAVCQARIGLVAAGSWFARLQSIGALGLAGIIAVYGNIAALVGIWILMCPLVGFIIWPYF